MATRRLGLGRCGDLYIADTYNNRIREVNHSTGVDHHRGRHRHASGYNGDGGQATAAYLSEPAGVALDSAGNIYIADSGNNASAR